MLSCRRCSRSTHRDRETETSPREGAREANHSCDVLETTTRSWREGFGVCVGLRQQSAAAHARRAARVRARYHEESRIRVVFMSLPYDPSYRSTAPFCTSTHRIHTTQRTQQRIIYSCLHHHHRWSPCPARPACPCPCPKPDIDPGEPTE